MSGATEADVSMQAEEVSPQISNPVLKALLEPGTPKPVLNFLYVVFFLLFCCSISLFWTELPLIHCCAVLFLSCGLIGSTTWSVTQSYDEQPVMSRLAGSCLSSKRKTAPEWMTCLACRSLAIANRKRRISASTAAAAARNCGIADRLQNSVHRHTGCAKPTVIVRGEF